MVSTLNMLDVFQVSTDSSSDAKHPCKMCGKKYTYLRDLNYHQKVHRGETYCPFCKRAYSTKGNLLVHLGNCHRIVLKNAKELADYLRTQASLSEEDIIPL